MIGDTIRFIAFLAVTGAGVAAFALAVLRRYAYVKLGKPAGMRENAKRRLLAYAAELFGHRKLLKDPKSGVMHIVLFYGFIVLQFGALDLIARGLFGRGLPIPGYAAFEFAQELTVLAVLLAVAYSAYRRYGEKLKRLKRGWKPSLVVWFIAGLMLSVLTTLAFDRLREDAPPAAYAPLSSLLASAMSGLAEGAVNVLFHVAWWAHLLILLAFLVYVPQSKHFHIVTAPINLWLRRTEPAGRLSALDLEDEDAESFGAGKIEDFTRKQLLDLYACVECGRCTNVCPAAGTGKPLSPMHLIVKLRDHLTEKGAAVTSRSPWVPAFAGSGTGNGAHAMAASGGGVRFAAVGAATDIGPTMAWQQAAWTKTDRDPRELALVGDVMTEDELWACTTCRNCEDQCPVGNEHVDKIVDMRRYLVLTQGSVPADGQRALVNIERQGNPWGISRSDRARWTEDAEPDGEPLRVPTVREEPDFEWLFFVGSMGSYDIRSRRVTRAFVRLLREAGVRFAILGNEERNSGDTPRRMGNELLFQELCAANIETFRKYGVRRIVTACPHTYNTLKNEYPAFGLEAETEVLHHTELLARLLQEGRLRPRHPVPARVAYHDSCYLGRYNGVYDAPRKIVEAIPAAALAEPARARANGMCCGAGGGLMWMEESGGKRVNIARIEQLLEVRPTVIGSACPYCLTMMEDGIKAKEAADAVAARDVAELLALSVFGSGADVRRT